MLDKDDYSMDVKEFQEQLVDISSTGKVRPWKDKKIKSLLLSELYRTVNEKKTRVAKVFFI